MKKSTKIWLWFALILCAATTVLNASYGRWPSVVIAVVSLVGLGLLLFRQKKFGFFLMCICYVLSFLVGVVGGASGGTSLAVSIAMSLIGSALVPVVTALFLRGQWDQLK